MNLENSVFYPFIKIHGIEAFNLIKNKIENEIVNSIYSVKFDETYLLYIFEIAFFSFCMVSKGNIPLAIDKMNDITVPIIPFEELLRIHKKSISLIKKYLKIGTDNMTKSKK